MRTRLPRGGFETVVPVVSASLVFSVVVVVFSAVVVVVPVAGLIRAGTALMEYLVVIRVYGWRG